MGTIFVGVIVLCIICISIKSIIKDKINGKSIQCGGSCRHCGGHCRTK